jgi:hypothetical protein
VNVEIVGGAGPGRELVAVGIRLREGATVLARVLEAATADDGMGLLSLAGAKVRAQLPQALQVGDRLRLLVAGTIDDKVVLKLLGAETANATRDVPAHAVAQLATQGDGELLRLAHALTDGVVPLPGGLVVAIDPDEEAASEEEDGGGEEQPQAMRLVIHSPALGALELRVGLAAGRLGVAVTAEPGRPFALAAEEQAALASRLEAVTGLPAAVGVTARRGPAPDRPEPPPLGEMTLYA